MGDLDLLVNVAGHRLDDERAGDTARRLGERLRRQRARHVPLLQARDPRDGRTRRRLDRQRRLDRRARRTAQPRRLLGVEGRRRSRSRARSRSTTSPTASASTPSRPGTVDSPWVRRLVEDVGESLDALRARQPLGRLGTPEEIADAILYLADGRVRHRQRAGDRRRPHRRLMLALVTDPGVPHSTRVADVAAPPAGDDALLMRVLEVGVCGTDREISRGPLRRPRRRRARSCSGTSRSRSSSATATASASGDLVTATVRRSCRHCLACAEGAPDSCLTGDYVRARHHAARRLRTRARGRGPAQVIPIPRVARPARRPRRADVDLRARAPPRAHDRRPPALAARARARRRRRRDRRHLDLPAPARRASTSGRRRSSRRASSSTRLGRALRLDGRRPLAEPARRGRRLRPRRSRPSATRR